MKRDVKASFAVGYSLFSNEQAAHGLSRVG
jgi:hypothetical protein